MTTTTTMTIRQQERAKLLVSSAAHRHVFTLNFSGGQVALLDVRGAADIEEARSIARSAVSSTYTVTDGDQAAGHAAYFYFWCSSAAQEVQPHRKQ